MEIKEIWIEDKNCEYKQLWKYFLQIKECDGKKTKYYINFIYPIKLQATTESKDIFEKLKKGCLQEIKNKWNSAIKTKYNSKLTDSFNTKFKLFVFHKFLCDKKFDIYFADNITTILQDFRKFKITPELADVFSSQYYQKNEMEEIIYKCDNCCCQKTVDEITKKLFDYDCVGNRKYDRNYVFDMINDEYRKEYKLKNDESENLYEQLKKCYLENNKLFTFCDFIKLISKTECYYCGINIDQIEELGKNGKLHNKRSDTRGYSLEIDRTSPNLEYSNDNCCMSCYWCNNAKTDEFSEDEFKNIACGINIAWNDRLTQIGSNSKVIFPWKNVVKCCK